MRWSLRCALRAVTVNQCRERLAPHPLLLTQREQSAHFERCQPLTQGVELASPFVNGPFTQSIMLMEALDPGTEPAQGAPGGTSKLLYEMTGHIAVLDAYFKQRRVVDGHLPEHMNSGFHQIPGWILAGWKLIQSPVQQVECPLAQSNNKPFLRSKDCVYGAGSRARLVSDPPHRQPGHAIRLYDLLGGVEKGLAGVGVVLFRSSHVDWVTQHT